MENQRQIVDTWVKLEKCLNEFDTEKAKNANRPMSSAPLGNRFQINKRRPESSNRAGGGTGAGYPNRPQTSIHPGPVKRPVSSVSHLRPFTAGASVGKNSLAQSMNFNKVINTLGLDQIIGLYEARCKDTQVDYLESQAKFFIDKFKISCVDRTFDMTEHNLGPITAALITKILMDSQEFIRLELGKNNLGDQGVQSIGTLLARNKHIIHTDLSSNDLTEEGVHSLCHSLMGNNTLVSLSLKSFEGLNRNKVGPKGCVHLKSLLSSTKTLMFLNLSATQIGLLGMKALCEGIKSNHSLIGLDLSNNYLGPGISKHLAGTLGISTLEELNLAHNKLGDAGVVAIHQLFGKDNVNRIRKLDLSSNGFTSSGLAKLLEALYDNKVIEDLILDFNSFTGSGVFYYLNTLLLETQSLRRLSMEKCDLEKYMPEEIKAGLTRNATLTHLLLKNNNIYDEGVGHLMEALAANTKVVCVDLCDNRLRDKAGVDIGAMLKKNTTLEELSLAGNTITENGAACLVEGLMQNKTLKRMRLRLNPIGYKYTQEIETLLALNNKQQEKEFLPQIEAKIRDLQQFEAKKDSVFDELEKKREELAASLRTNARAQAEANKVMAQELAQSQEVELQFEEVLRRYGKLEAESHILTKLYNEHKQNHNLAVIGEQKRKEKIDKEYSELLEKHKELQLDYNVKEETDKKKIEELKIEIAKEKRFIEEDLKKLLDLENQYSKQLRIGQEDEQAANVQLAERQANTASGQDKNPEVSGPLDSGKDKTKDKIKDKDKTDDKKDKPASGPLPNKKPAPKPNSQKPAPKPATSKK